MPFCGVKDREKVQRVFKISAMAIFLPATVFLVVSTLPTLPLLSETRPRITVLLASNLGGASHQDEHTSASRQDAETSLVISPPGVHQAEEPEERNGAGRSSQGSPYPRGKGRRIETPSSSGRVSSHGEPPKVNLDVDPSTPEARRRLDVRIGDTRNANSRRDNGRRPPAPLDPQERENRSGEGTDSPKAFSIQSNAIPFIQRPDEWRVPGHGISLDPKGEPKAGTTWFGALVAHLAVDLCGGPNNTWCELGGVVAAPTTEGAWYEFEMLKKGSRESDRPTLFLHFKGNRKHTIAGMEMAELDDDRCRNGGRAHLDSFDTRPPCESTEPPTRARLLACVWDTTPRCLQYMPSVDPAVRRTVVIVRDPRNVVLSERKMKIQHYKQKRVRDMSADDFIHLRFEILVSWTHQRWNWHTGTVMNMSSHVVLYEDLQERHDSLIGLAAFMGLHCSESSALKVWRSHQSTSPHADYSKDGLRPETVEWMNATMARLLPPALALRWGLTPTDG